MNLIKHILVVTLVLKQILNVVKTLRSLHWLRQLFDKLCMEKYKKLYIIIVSTKTQWGIVYYAAQQVSAVKAACASLPGEILNADLNIVICDKLKALITDPAYWKDVASFKVLFKAISLSCFTYLEGGNAAFTFLEHKFSRVGKVTTVYGLLSGGSGTLALLVKKLCRKYGDMSQSSGTPCCLLSVTDQYKRHCYNRTVHTTDSCLESSESGRLVQEHLFGTHKWNTNSFGHCPMCKTNMHVQKEQLNQ